ncbi:MAG: TlpA family protein disulfide reductase [Bacteroidia bacterium]
MKFLITSLLSALCLHGLAQEIPSIPEPVANAPINFAGEFSNCSQSDSIRIYDFVGLSLRQVAALALKNEGTKSTFSVSLNGVQPGFYFIGMQPNQTIPLILGAEPAIYLSSDCKNFQNMQISGSPMNRDYQTVSKTADDLNQQANTIMQQFRFAPEDPALFTQLKKVDDGKRKLFDSLKIANPYLAKNIALRTYYSFQNNHLLNEKEEDYFARTFLMNVDFGDKDFDKIPAVFNTVQSYAQTLGMIGLSAEDQQMHADKLLKNVSKDRPVYPLLLLGLATGFKGKDDDSFNKYAQLYLKDFALLNQPITADFNATIQKIQKTLIGAPALDFKLPTPDGKELGISDFKGKVVMVDFWASWCKPCRKENPNVVRMYNRFHNQGFEILSVSLDQNKEAWTNAIQMDGLNWNHISDLAGWNCAGSKLYGVTGIPYTLLIDKDGRILAKNLRGDALEKKLEKIFAK